jgi:hypothetical protein
MASTEFIKARLSPELKARARALAERQLLTESTWIKQLVIRELQSASCGGGAAVEGGGGMASAGHQQSSRGSFEGRSGRVYVRLRREDQELLQARAAVRGMRAATYVSTLTRAHLRRLAPLPKDELLALRRSIGELAAIGRNLNQIARVANDGGRLPTSARDEFRSMLQVCEALRDNTKALLKANLTSWKTGHGEDV